MILRARIRIFTVANIEDDVVMLADSHGGYARAKVGQSVIIQNDIEVPEGTYDVEVAKALQANGYQMVAL